MRRSLSIRVATLLVIVATSTMPAFAAPPSDDSPIGGVERAIARIFKQIRKIIVTPLEQLGAPK